MAIGLPLAGAAEAQTDESAVTAEDQGTVEDPANKIDAGQTRVAGTVTDVFGNKFVLRTDDGHLLVTTGPDWYHRLEVRAGDTATIVGEYAGGGFDAFRIIDADGTEREIRPVEGPPGWAEKRVPSWASQGGDPPGWGGRPDAERRGRPPWAGQRSDKGSGPPRERDRRESRGSADGRAAQIPEAEIVRVVESAGYEDLAGLEQRGRHLEIIARNPEGEIVELRLHTDGEIVRERRLRGQR